jgi:hypothetical protein
MTDRDHIHSETVNFRDWVLGQGEFSPEKTAQAYRAAAERMGRMAAQRMLESLDAALASLDAGPAAIAQPCEKSRPQAVSELGNPVRHSTQGGAGNAHEPVAWAVVYPNGEAAIIAFRKADAEDMASASDRVVPLYRQPQTTLTDEEREAIKMAIAACKVEGELNQACDGRQSFAGLWHDHAGALRSLLERLG